VWRRPALASEREVSVEERMRRIPAALLFERHITNGLDAYVAAARIIAAADRIADLEHARPRRGSQPSRV
jgi:hypothetical protein